MIRLVLYLLVVLAAVVALHWLADRPGTVTVEWLGYVAETSMFRALVILAALLAAILLTWSALRQVWRTPAAFGRYLYRRRQQRGLDAITSGIIAVGAGDRTLAVRYAAQARKALPHEPLTHLLRAQAAQIGGDRATARRIFEAMLASPDTEQLGLRGLFLEAEREGEREAARQFAERALQKNPQLGWPVQALFDLQCRAADWHGALATLAVAQRQHLIDKAPANRRRAVLLTAQAQGLEDNHAERALELALEAHKLAPDLVPAAAIAGRVLASRGKTPRAARVLLKTWRVAPHPDLAAAYAYARPGDSPRDRIARMRHLSRLTPNHTEAQLALALAAIETRDWDEARQALAPLIDDGRLTPRVCTLMARIEGEQHGNAGRVREWLARAATAGRDPAWVADGVASERWSPVSPVTGALDAMRWSVPAEAAGEASAAAALAAKVEALIGLSAPERAPIEAAPQAPAPAQPGSQRTGAVAADGRAAPAAEASVKLLPAGQPSGRTAAPPAPAAILAPPPPAQAQQAHVEPLDEAGASDVPFRRKVAAPGAGHVRARKSVETRIFVPPRAPDDPGADAPEGDDLAPFSTSGAKV